MKADRLPSVQVTGLLSLLVGASLLMPGARSVGSAFNSGQRPVDLTPHPIEIPSSHTRAFAEDEVIVKLAGSEKLTRSATGRLTASGDLGRTIECFGFTSATEIVPGTYKLCGPDVDAQTAVNALRASHDVAYAEPDAVYHSTAAPDDEHYVEGQQWGVSQIKAEQAWDITTGSPDIIIAILDTGTATDHPDLHDKIVAGHDFVNNDEDPYDDNGHGTYTAGIAAAMSNNGSGITGISWGARIMPVKVLDSLGHGNASNIASGIHWAVDNGARVINASLGGDFDSQAMRDAVQYAADHNVLVVAASGNTAGGKPNYPAAYPSVLAVGATGRSDTYAGFSSWGPDVAVTAPGVDIFSTGWHNGSLTYTYDDGTSAACPFVSGVAALVWSVNPSLTAEQVKQIIEDSSDDLGDPGWDEHYGYGRLNAFRAVQMAQQGVPPTHTPTPIHTNTPAAAPTSSQEPGPALTLDNVTLAPGTLLWIQGVGYAPNELIKLTLNTADGKSLAMGGVIADFHGSFRAEVALPRGASPGNATVTATGSSSHAQSSESFVVTGSTAGKSRVQGTIEGVVSGGNITVTLRPSSSADGQELTTKTDAHGSYSFAGLAADMYSISASATGYLPAGPYMVQLDGTASDAKTIDFPISTRRPPALERVSPMPNTPNLLYFGPVGHTLKGPFLKFWQSHGGLAIFGYPITEEFQETSLTDGRTYTVQYFERNRFEYHPEFANTPNEVLMGLLGVDSTRGRTFLPGAPFEGDSTHAYFKETQHSLSGPFLKYWQLHGGLAVFGYPISEELIEGGYRVQYFERNRFEYHPEFANTPNEVLLGLLGVETAKRNGWIAP